MGNKTATVITRFRFKSKEDELASLNRITGLEFSSMPVSLVNGNRVAERQDDAVLRWASQG